MGGLEVSPPTFFPLVRGEMRERERDSVEMAEILINCVSLSPGTAGWTG